jgi:hypothetical protein
MSSDSFVEAQLVETKAFRNVEPVILASGEVGFFDINTERLVGDGNRFKEFGEDSKAMYLHTLNMMGENPDYNRIIELVAEKADELTSTRGFISGGQTRDWLFSCPVAYKLRLPHVSIYKNGEMEIIQPDGERVDFAGYVQRESINTETLHITSLLEGGNDCHRVVEGEEFGWVPSLRNNSLSVDKLISIVDRGQGGVENLQTQGVEAHSFVEIDEDFLRRNSGNVERDVAYLQNPQAVVEAYLKNNGALSLIEQFNPEAEQGERCKAFLARYGDFLAENERLFELDTAIDDRYKIRLRRL